MVTGCHTYCSVTSLYGAADSVLLTVSTEDKDDVLRFSQVCRGES